MYIYDNNGDVITALTINEIYGIVNAMVVEFECDGYVGVDLYLAVDSHGEVWLYTLPPVMELEYWAQPREVDGNDVHWVREKRECSVPKWKESLTKVRVMEGTDKMMSFIINGRSYYLERVV